MNTPPVRSQVPESIFVDRTLWYSGFCLTDQKYFALFFVTEDFMAKHGLPTKVNFDLTADSLNMVFDPSVGISEATFDDQDRFMIFPEGNAYVSKLYWNWFKATYPDMITHPVTIFFGKEVFSLWVVLQEPKGRPVGILKLHPMSTKIPGVK